MSCTYFHDHNEGEEDDVTFVVIDKFQEKFGAAVSFSKEAEVLMESN